MNSFREAISQLKEVHARIVVDQIKAGLGFSLPGSNEVGIKSSKQENAA